MSLQTSRQPHEQARYLPSQGHAVGRPEQIAVPTSRVCVLPRDLPEVHRLDFQHYLMQSILGSNALAPIDPAATRILDVASGTGRWAHEMARAFPFAQVVGLDLEPPPDYGQVAPPPNYQFVQHDLFTRFPFADQHFDLVHQRFLVLVVAARHWPSLLAELGRVTRLGGFVELVEGGSTFLNAGSATLHLVQWWDRASQRYGIDASLMTQLPQLLLRIGLHNVQHKTYQVPLGRWGGRVGEKVKTNLLAGLAGSKHLSAHRPRSRQTISRRYSSTSLRSGSNCTRCMNTILPMGNDES